MSDDTSGYENEKDINPFSGVVDDLTVLRIVLADDGPVTDVVINGIFRWFVDVELELPLPVMQLGDKQRKALAHTIVEEMIENFAEATRLINEFGLDKFNEEVETLSEVAPDQVKNLDNLWRELAGCYSQLLNKSVPKLEMSQQEEDELYSGFISKMAGDLDISEDEARDVVRNDSAFRLMLRRQGINPDRIL